MTVSQLKLKVNPIQQIIDVQAQIKALEKLEKAFKEQIVNLMDQHGDQIELDGFKAERKMTVASVVDTARVKEILEDATPMKEQARITYKFM